MPTQDLTGPRKAAILLTALSPDIASEILRHLQDDELERVAMQISNQTTIDPQELATVLREFHELFVARYLLGKGGLDYAQDLLRKGVGAEKAKEVLSRLNAATRPLNSVRLSDPVQLASFIQNEHPQTIAAILAHLNPDQAGGILGSLPVEWQTDVLRRVATLDRTSPEVLSDVERVLNRKMSSLGQADFTAGGGLKLVVDVLNRIETSVSKTIMENMSEQDPELAEEIKKNMFLFNDIVMLDNRSLQQVLQQVDMLRDMPLALKLANDQVKAKIFACLSKRAGENLKDAIDTMGPVRMRDVETAQGRIISIIRQSEERGDIVISRGAGSDYLV